MQITTDLDSAHYDKLKTLQILIQTGNSNYKIEINQLTTIWKCL